MREERYMKGNKHKISLDEVIDYAKCPMLYKLKYVDKIGTEYTNLINKYKEDIKTIIYSSLYKIVEFENIQIEHLKIAWGKLWIKDKRKSNIIFSETLSNKDTYNERRKSGLDALLYFHKEFKDPGIPIAINKEYEIDISNNLVLTGKFELIRKYKSSIDTAIFKLDENHLQKLSLQYDLELNALNIANKKYINSMNKTITMYNLDKKKKININIKNLNEETFKNTVLNIYKAIYNKLFYIVPSERCVSCIYKDICTKKL